MEEHGDLFLSANGSLLNVANSGHRDVNAETFHAAQAMLLNRGNVDTFLCVMSWLSDLSWHTDCSSGFSQWSWKNCAQVNNAMIF